MGKGDQRAFNSGKPVAVHTGLHEKDRDRGGKGLVPNQGLL